MNFDEMKNEWSADTLEPAPAETSKSHRRQSTDILAQIRRNMRREWTALLLSYVIIIVLAYIFSSNAITLFIISIGGFLLFLQSAYFSTRFYRLYNRLARYDLNMRKSIRKLVYDLELNIEIYRTYSICSIPLATCVGFCIPGSKGLAQTITYLVQTGALLQPANLFIVACIVIICQVLTIFFLNLYIRMQYGIYLAELKRIMEDLDSDS